MKKNFRGGLKYSLNKQQKGFTLIELLLVVGIMALGAVVAYVTLPKVRSTANANSEAASINTLSAGIKNVYAGSNSYKTLTNKVLIDAKAVPEKMLTGTANSTELVNSFGGLVTVAPTKLGSNASTQNNSAYTITYTNVPDAECVKISTGVGNNFSEVSVNGTKIRQYPTTDPVDPGAASLNCQGQSDSNTIVFANQ